MSSPGSGKTSLLERTIAELAPTREVCVIEGDQETTFDAERIQRAGARAVQVNTGAGCHLDAAHGAARPRRRSHPRDGLAAVRRERRQPGLPGAVRRRRARQGRGHLGDRGRRQAVEVPAHVRAPPTSWWSTRPTCCRTSTSTSTRSPSRPAALNPGVDGAAAVGAHRRRDRRLVRLARPAGQHPRHTSRRSRAWSSRRVREASERIDDAAGRARAERRRRPSWSGSRSSCSA